MKLWPTDGRHHGSGHPLHDAIGDELPQTVRGAAKGRGEDEKGDRGAKNATGSEAFGDPAAHGDKNRQRHH